VIAPCVATPATPLQRRAPMDHALRRKATRRLDRSRRVIQWIAIPVALCGLVALRGGAEDLSREEMRSLDEQVQDIKSDVLGIAEELGQLEEKLLYPSNTQVSVFVSLVEGESLRLDSAHILIDDEVVAQHIYSFKELEALQRGGVQRIFTGNVSTGEHQLQVKVAGKLPSGADFEDSQSFGFRKEAEPKILGITLGGSGDSSIRIGGW